MAAELTAFEDVHQRRCATVELMRGQNRFVAAMEQARYLVEATA